MFFGDFVHFIIVTKAVADKHCRENIVVNV